MCQQNDVSCEVSLLNAVSDVISRYFLFLLIVFPLSDFWPKDDYC